MRPVDDYDLLDDHDIEYETLDETILQRLATGDDLFKANSALYELKHRNSQQAQLIAADILANGRGDRFLQAAALEILYDVDQSAALAYIQQHHQDCDPYVLSSILSILSMDESWFRSRGLRALIRSVYRRASSVPTDSKFPEPSDLERFRKTFHDVLDEG